MVEWVLCHSGCSEVVGKLLVVQPALKPVALSSVERRRKLEVLWWEVQDELSVEQQLVASEKVRLQVLARWLDMRQCSGLLDGGVKSRKLAAMRLLLMLKAQRVLKVVLE